MNDPSTPRPVTQRMIAEALGVSHSTVSRALRNDSRIPEARCREVQAAAEEMGYQFNPMAVALSHHRKASRSTPVRASLAWVNFWPTPEEMYRFREFQYYYDGAVQEAHQDGYRIEEFAVAGGLSMRRLQRILHARGIRGILLPPSGGHLPPDWDRFNWQGFCVVRFGHSVRNPPFHLVSSDQVTDGIIGYEQIREKGYRRIGVVYASRSHTRFAAGARFQQGRSDNGYDCPDLSLQEKDPAEDRKRLRAWMERHQPDAIFTGVARLSDLLKDIGYRVPDDVGLAAFSVLDGNADAGIDQNSAEIGKAAVQLLISLMHHHQQGIPEFCRELLVEGRWQDGSMLPQVSR